MRHAAKHFQVGVLLAEHTPMPLIVDDALGVFRVDVDPELRERGVLFCTYRSHRTGSLNTKSLGSDVAGGASPEYRTRHSRGA